MTDVRYIAFYLKPETIRRLHEVSGDEPIAQKLAELIDLEYRRVGDAPKRGFEW